MNSIKRENLEQRTTITETENSLEGFKSMFKQKNQLTDSDSSQLKLPTLKSRGEKENRKEKKWTKLTHL